MEKLKNYKNKPFIYSKNPKFNQTISIYNYFFSFKYITSKIKSTLNPSHRPIKIIFKYWWVFRSFRQSVTEQISIKWFEWYFFSTIRRIKTSLRKIRSNKALQNHLSCHSQLENSFRQPVKSFIPQAGANIRRISILVFCLSPLAGRIFETFVKLEPNNSMNKNGNFRAVIPKEIRRIRN